MPQNSESALYDCLISFLVSSAQEARASCCGLLHDCANVQGGPLKTRGCVAGRFDGATSCGLHIQSDLVFTHDDL